MGVELWFVVHRTGNGVVLSIDFERALMSMPEQDVVVTVPDPPAPPPSPLAAERVDPGVPPPSPRSTSCTRRLTTPTPVKRRQHTHESDIEIRRLVAVYGTRWRYLARVLGGADLGWTDDVVRNRYIRICSQDGLLYPRQSRLTKRKKRDYVVEKWTPQEDAELSLLVRSTERAGKGIAWSRIASELGGVRTAQAIRNRANRIGLIFFRQIR